MLKKNCNSAMHQLSGTHLGEVHNEHFEMLSEIITKWVGTDIEIREPEGGDG